eukprot:gene10572-12231_t
MIDSNGSWETMYVSECDASTNPEQVASSDKPAGPQEGASDWEEALYQQEHQHAESSSCVMDKDGIGGTTAPVLEQGAVVNQHGSSNVPATESDSGAVITQHGSSYVPAAVLDQGGMIENLPPVILSHILSFLHPADLCAVNATCRNWRAMSSHDVAADNMWRDFFLTRWTPAATPKAMKSRSWTGKFTPDSLYGHRGGVRCCKLLSSHGLLVTGSLDKPTRRLWDLTSMFYRQDHSAGDLHSGLPLSVSRAHGGTVRSVALDDSALLSGGADNLIRLWRPQQQLDKLQGEGPGGGTGGDMDCPDIRNKQDRHKQHSQPKQDSQQEREEGLFEGEGPDGGAGGDMDCPDIRNKQHSRPKQDSE